MPKAAPNPLRLTLYRQRTFNRQQCQLATHDLVDPCTQRRPMVLLNGEVPPQVKQRGLARTAADPLALDQSIGEVAFAGSGIVGVGATYIHAAKIAQTG